MNPPLTPGLLWATVTALLYWKNVSCPFLWLALKNVISTLAFKNLKTYVVRMRTSKVYDIWAVFLDFVENIYIDEALHVLSYAVFKLTWGMYDINCHIFMPFLYCNTARGKSAVQKIFTVCKLYKSKTYIYIYIFFFFWVITALTQPAPFVQDIHNIIFYYLVKHTADHKSIQANIKNNATFQNATI